MNLEVDMEAFKEANMSNNFNYELGNTTDGSLPEFITNID